MCTSSPKFPDPPKPTASAIQTVSGESRVGTLQVSRARQARRDDPKDTLSKLRVPLQIPTATGASQ
ncbi:MAG: hypothetical protein Unbinned767contig1000_34 [Prokaryotic dsDNA virus sp.]|nr:MAG: hypothetical protein Unbinned767contig1000_34 [Prokaryotic dsDNA virus sp.]